MINLCIQDFQWINGMQDDPDDQCAHGRVLFHINNTLYIKPEEGIWTVSACALYLLRTLTEDHTIKNPVAESNFLFPCCGFNVWPTGNLFKVICIGCNNGIDVEIVHHQDMVTIKSLAGSESVPQSEWVTAVLGFSKSVQEFYQSSSSKARLEDKLEKQGWACFWQEWYERYQLALTA